MTQSVTIITKNEEDRIRRCLGSVKALADKIIVLNSGSVDRTLETVAEYTDKIYKTDWPGFGVQKQCAPWRSPARSEDSARAVAPAAWPRQRIRPLGLIVRKSGLC